MTVPPASLAAVHAKKDGTPFSRAALFGVIEDIASRRYSSEEIAAFLVACAASMSAEEILDLTEAMAGTGSRLEWPTRPIVDIHSIGGVPGNRVSMIVVPIIAAHGLIIPKTSSRAITTPAGTADTMEVLARVALTLDEIRAVIAAERGCLVWGGHANLAPADDVLISVERSLDADVPAQLVASILSKKLAAGITHLLLELPIGPAAKLQDEASAARLRALFDFVAARTGLTLDIAVTDGTAPIGRGIGPALEARDVLKVLRGDGDAPRDLRERALALAARLLEIDPALRGKGPARARELLQSGMALAKFERIAAAQGAPPAPSALGSLTREIRARQAGRVAAIDCARVGQLAALAGAPAEKGAGVDLLKKPGDAVSAGEPLYRIHACRDRDFRCADAAAAEDSGYRIAG